MLTGCKYRVGFYVGCTAYREASESISVSETWFVLTIKVDFRLGEEKGERKEERRKLVKWFICPNLEDTWQGLKEPQQLSRWLVCPSLLPSRLASKSHHFPQPTQPSGGTGTWNQLSPLPALILAPRLRYPHSALLWWSLSRKTRNFSPPVGGSL
jgi:hypothetical protein